MTEKDEKLLLRDLCARLPHKVKISIPDLWINKERIETLNEIFKGNDDLYRVNDSGLLIKYIKPYLFPLSSMTDEQKMFLKQQNWCIAISTSGTVETTVEGIDWLNKNHFDFRGLIPMGLAIDATGLNIY